MSDPTSDLFHAFRAAVLSTERYRLRVAREVLGMGATEMLTLGGLAAEGARTPTQIAGQLQMTTASVTELVDRLAGAGLVRRIPHPDDRRKVLVELTETGRDKAGLVTGPFTDALVRGATEMSADECRIVMRFLTVAASEIDAAEINGADRGA